MDLKYEIRGKKLEDMNILITGGAGVIGGNIVNNIPGNITVLDNLSSGKLEAINALINEKKISIYRA